MGSKISKDQNFWISLRWTNKTKNFFKKKISFFFSRKIKTLIYGKGKTIWDNKFLWDFFLYCVPNYYIFKIGHFIFSPVCLITFVNPPPHTHTYTDTIWAYGTVHVYVTVKYDPKNYNWFRNTQFLDVFRLSWSTHVYFSRNYLIRFPIGFP